MKQVVAIHGGDAFATYEEFWNSLLEKVVHLEWLQFRDWKNNLQPALGEGYEVILPRMPNPQNAKYKEWKLMFEKIIPQLQEEVILIGHSLGGSFLAKYLSENKFPKKIAATFFVAPPFDTDGARKLVEFDITNDLEKLRKQGGRLFFYQSEDDPVVSYAEQQKFKNFLPEATYRMFTDRQHFNQAEFPELLDDLRSFV